MNPVTLRALFTDAWYQVLDNRVFRVVVLLISIPVAASFVVGFQEEEVVLLFGWRTIPYSDLLRFADVEAESRSLGQLRGLVIETLVDRVVGFLSGTLGVVVALAATAFFLPRTLERGAAEVVFTRPVARGWVWASRYAAGLLFIGLLSATLLAGVFAGLLLASGYAYPGLFWALPSVLYVFAVVHAISMLVGVTTRSSSAAILLTLAFFLFNGCVHNGWMLKEAHLRSEAPGKPPGPTLSTFYRVLDAGHLVLPKTGDADAIVDELRGEPEPSAFGAVRVNGEVQQRRLEWGAELGNDILFSIASTVAFTLVALGLGWRKLERIDF